MDLLGRFSNHETAGRVDRLWNGLKEQKLLHPASSGASRPGPAVRRLRRKPGEVQVAAFNVLRTAHGPMRLPELHAALIEKLDDNVTRSSVKMLLKRGLDARPPIFQRPRRGLYRLAKPLGDGEGGDCAS
jgi:hypothetical protein